MSKKSSADTERPLEQKSQLEHIKLKPNMYINSVSLQNTQMYILNNEIDKFELKDIEFSPGLLKIFDEILVNAIDQYTNYPKIVDAICITFDIGTGMISVKNTGKGISIVEKESLYDGKMYKPQMIFSQFLTSDNYDSSKDDTRIVGGQNGIGAKATNAFSDIFIVETFDSTKKLLYKQTFRDGMSIIEPPIITEHEIMSSDDESEIGGATSDADEESNNSSASGSSTTTYRDFTQITFLPSYTRLGYKKYDEEIGKVINKLIELRTYQTAVFVPAECEVSFNGIALTYRPEACALQQLADHFIQEGQETYNTTLVNSSNKQLNLDVCIMTSDGKFRSMSVINGISVYEGGTHIKHICNELLAFILPQVNKIIGKSKITVHQTAILNNLFIFVKGYVQQPEFSSQSKTKLMTPIEKFKSYKFTTADQKKIWALLEPHIMASVLGKLKDTSKSRVNRTKLIMKKGSDAKFAGDKKKSSECSLFIAEGDSALSLLDEGINHKNTELNRDYCGTYTIQGVCPNARKEVDIYEDKLNNTVTVIRNDKLQKNERFNMLEKLLGLDYNKKYTDGTREGDTEVKTLRYGSVIVATDADVDGKGMIFGLILNFFSLFWPELIKRGYLRRFNTPVIRAFPKNAKSFVKEFYALHEYDAWVDKKYGGDSELAKKEYDIRYYKGLAGNDTKEIEPTFAHFNDKLNIYVHDDGAKETLDIYFGKDPSLRKKELCSPVSKQDILECTKSNNIDITDFLHTDVKEFQRDNILRKLPHILDGLVPSRRKVLFCARLNKGMATKEIKVVNFTGEVISNSGYQHGDASLSKTIIKMAQTYVGAKNLPLLTGIGQFGSRRRGGKDAGSPRYIYIKSNKALTNAIFPVQDDFLLPYIFEEGNRVEPEYYLPIIPMSILESMQIPATGWRVKLWARDYTAVMKNVRRMVTCEIVKCKKLPIWMRGNSCEIRLSNDKLYMVGKYEYDEKTNTVKITELPISIYNDTYIKSIAMTKDNTLINEIKNFEDYSYYDDKTNTDHIDIQFELKDGAMDEIKKKYAKALKDHKLITADLPDIPESSNEVKQKKTVATKVLGDDDISDEIEHEIDVAEDAVDADSISQSGKVESYEPDPLFDHIEEFFKLRLCINSDINMINKSQEVSTISAYSKVVNTWFAARKQLYKDRIERECILDKLMIKYIKNIIRFSKEREGLDITNKTPEAKFNEILETNKFAKFDKPMLLNPKYCKVSELEDKILHSDKASYAYIIDLTYRSLLKDACDAREVELEKKIKELELVEEDCEEDDTSFIGQKTWLRELDDLDKIITKGIEKGWDIQKNPPKFK